MSVARLYLDGELLHDRYEVQFGKYDFANELFGEPNVVGQRFTNLSVYRDDEEAFGVVLHDHHDKKLLAVFLK